MYEFHLFEPLDEEINAKKVIAVEDATYEREPEKIKAYTAFKP